MVLADTNNYPFLEVLWTLLIFFGWVMWFWLLIIAFSDIFRRHDISGWVKAAWILFMFVIPLFGVLIYLGFNGKGLAERNVKSQADAQAQFDDYVKTVAADQGPTAEIAKAKALLDAGTITQAEFDAIKAKALAA